MSRADRRRPSSRPTTKDRSLGRRSMDAHRRWLIDQYGSVCAYCGVEIPEDRTTLDHVYPRKGQTAYDRPDNLFVAGFIGSPAMNMIPGTLEEGGFRAKDATIPIILMGYFNPIFIYGVDTFLADA